MKAANKILKYAEPLGEAILARFHRYPYLSAVICCFLYLLVFQLDFLATGDAWAESFAEYLDESVRFGWLEVFQQNWAGYFSLIPSFLAKAYVAVGLPLGYIDIYYKIIVVAFAISTVSIFALKVNRTLIQSDSLRTFLAIGTLAILSDITSFSFINIWYLPLLPLIFTYLNVIVFSTKHDVSLGVLGALVSLTKPFLIMLPIVILRAIRSRQWVGPAIFLTATAIQTYQIIFNDRRQLVENADISLTTTVGGIISGSSVSFLKFFGIYPSSLWMIGVALGCLVLIFALLWWTRGIWTAAVLSLVYVFGVYTYVLAPDFPAYSGFYNFAELYEFNFKTQREVLINGSLLISIFFLIDSFISYIGRYRINSVSYLRIFLPIILLAVIYTPIDTVSAGVSIKPIEPFRQDLNQDFPTCVPLSPTPVFIADTNWFYAHNTKCNTPTHDTNLFKPDFSNMNTAPSRAEFIFDAKYFRMGNKSLGAIVVPIFNEFSTNGELVVRDNDGNTYKGVVEPRKGIQFISINTRGSMPRDSYRFTFTSTSKTILLGNFLNSKNAMVYLYFLG